MVKWIVLLNQSLRGIKTLTKDHLKLLDMDEQYRELKEDHLKPYINACKLLCLTLDAASSDVVLYIENEWGESICCIG